jgi:hypothetical protein
MFPSTPFSSNLSACSSRNVRDQVSHPYNTADEIPFLYILILRQHIQDSVVAHVPEIESSPNSFMFVISIS